jgi:hypothetical protein
VPKNKGLFYYLQKHLPSAVKSKKMIAITTITLIEIKIVAH